MKVLSVMNPWAYWIIYGSLAYGVKDVENRKYRTNFRGRILIHASQKIDVSIPDRDEIRMNAGKRIDWSKYNGRILGSVEIVDCVQDSESGWANKGLWHWVLRDPVIFDYPQLAKGSLGLWDFDTHTCAYYEMIRSTRPPKNRGGSV
jgi:hypothetical protein